MRWALQWSTRLILSAKPASRTDGRRQRADSRPDWERNALARNGFIERSNRTDKKELFNQVRFRDSEDRRYQLKLWEMEYNTCRPHQGLDNQIPFAVYQRDYPLHAASRYTT